MRVLILTPVYPSRNSPAEGIFNEQQAQALRRTGVDVTVVVCKQWLPESLARKWRRYRFLQNLPTSECRDGIHILYARYLHVPNHRLLRLTIESLAHAVTRAVWKEHRANPYDIIHIHSSWPTGLAGPLLENSLGIPFIVTLHIKDHPRLYHSRAGRGLYRRMFERAAAIIAVGTPLEQFAQEVMSASANTPVTVIPNGIELRAIEAIWGVSRSSREWGHIVSVSSLVPLKGIDYNLRALRLLDQRGVKSWRYTVVGDGPERQRLEALAEDLSIAHKVAFLGALPHEDALKAIAEADIFCLPAWQEAFGIVYLEAMALGKPVIGCWGQGAEDIIRHGVEGILVPPHSVDDLAHALKQILLNPKWAQSLGQAGRERAREFTWERNATATMALYRRIKGDDNPHGEVATS